MSKHPVSAAGGAVPAEGHKSRRAALGLFASASALAVMPAVAQPASLEVDPIFAAIRRHNEAWRAFGAAGGRTDCVVAENEGRKVTEVDEAVCKAASAEGE